MVKRLSTRRAPDHSFRQVTVQGTSVQIIADAASTSGPDIVIWGALDEPVLRATNAELRVRLRLRGDERIGAAMSVANNTWRLDGALNHVELDALLVIVAVGRLSHVQVLSNPIHRGKAMIRSLVFSTRPFDE